MKRYVPGEWFPVRGEPALSIGWASVAKRRDAIQRHFGMTLERAAETCALDWHQLWIVFHDDGDHAQPATIDEARMAVLKIVQLEHAPRP